METTGGMFAIYLLGIILGGIVALVCLIFTIIMLANGKKNPSIIWGVSFIVSLCVLILFIIQMVQGVVGKAKDRFKDLAELNNQHQHKDYAESEYASETAKKKWLDTLQFYVRENVKSKVPADFYENKKVQINADGSVIAPFIYPYSLKFSRDNYGVADVINDQNDSVFVRNVLSFSFDENFVIAKIDNKGSADLLKNGSPEIEYILFDMRTGVYESYNNEEKLHNFADRIGFVGSLSMRYLSTEYYFWINKMNTEKYY